MVSPVGAALADFASLISRDVKAQIFSRQHTDAGSWVAGTALEDSGAVEEFFGAVRSHLHRHAGDASTASDGAGLAGIGALFSLPAGASFEAKLLSVLAILGFCAPISVSVCVNLLPTIVREYSYWADWEAPAKLITRICAVIARASGQVCINELTSTGTLAVLVRNVTTPQGKHALKVRARSPSVPAPPTYTHTQPPQSFPNPPTLHGGQYWLDHE